MALTDNSVFDFSPTYNGVPILPGDKLDDPKFGDTGGPPGPARPVPPVQGGPGGGAYGTPEFLHDTPQPGLVDVQNPVLPPPPPPPPQNRSGFFEGVFEQDFQDDFRGFVTSQRSRLGGSQVGNRGEAELRALYDRGRRHFGLDASDLINPSTDVRQFFPLEYDENTLARLPNVGAAPGSTGSGAGFGDAEKIFNQNVFSAIELLLKRYGIGGLSGDVRAMVVNEASLDEIKLWLFDQTEFKSRFPAIAMIDAENTGGATRPQISPEEYLTLEQDYFEFLSRVGLSDGFFTRDRVATWIFEGVSPAEVSRRATNGLMRVQQATPELRQAFQDFYGVTGDNALASYFLDAENLEDELLRQVEVADIGGRAKISNIGIGQAGSERLAQLGITPGQAGTGFGNINRRGGLFRETVTEAADFTKELQGFTSQFNLDDGTSSNQLEQRLNTRTAAFRGGGGAAISSRATGFGTV